MADTLDMPATGHTPDVGAHSRAPEARLAFAHHTTEADQPTSHRRTPSAMPRPSGRGVEKRQCATFPLEIRLPTCSNDSMRPPSAIIATQPPKRAASRKDTSIFSIEINWSINRPPRRGSPRACPGTLHSRPQPAGPNTRYNGATGGAHRRQELIRQPSPSSGHTSSPSR